MILDDKRFRNILSESPWHRRKLLQLMDTLPLEGLVFAIRYCVEGKAFVFARGVVKEEEEERWLSVAQTIVYRWRALAHCYQAPCENTRETTIRQTAEACFSVSPYCDVREGRRSQIGPWKMAVRHAHIILLESVQLQLDSRVWP